jgi:hypothetical protein
MVMQIDFEKDNEKIKRNKNPKQHRIYNLIHRDRRNKGDGGCGYMRVRCYAKRPDTKQ